MTGSMSLSPIEIRIGTNDPPLQSSIKAGGLSGSFPGSIAGHIPCTAALLSSSHIQFAVWRPLGKVTTCTNQRGKPFDLSKYSLVY